MIDLSHIHPDYRHYAGFSAEERIHSMWEPRWIGYSVASAILERLKALLDTPRRPRMPNLLLVGGPNNGKTTIVRRFHESHGQPYVNEQQYPVKPVVIADAPPTPDEKSLHISILRQFSAPFRETQPTSALRYQAVHMLQYCKTRMLILDELHSLLAGSAAKQRVVMNAIKLLCNELNIPIVGVGTAEAVLVLHTDEQHTSRFDVVRLPKWELNTEFQRLLASFESILPLREKSSLQQPEVATLIHAFSDGVIGNVHRLLIECATAAIRSGAERIDAQLVKEHKWMQPTDVGIREHPA